MPTPLPQPADTNLEPPHHEEVQIIARGLASATSAAEGLMAEMPVDDQLRRLASTRNEVELVLMLRRIDPTVPDVAVRIVEIQRAAYAVEADLIGFDGIPQLVETEDEVRQLGHMSWMGAVADELLVGLIAWEETGAGVEIDRLAVDPACARQGLGRRLVRAVPSTGTTMVSTGAANHPAVSLYLREGFEQTGSVEIAPDVLLAQFQRRA